MLVIANNGKYNDLLWEQLEQGKILCAKCDDFQFDIIYFHNEKSIISKRGFNAGFTKTKLTFEWLLKMNWQDVKYFYCCDKTKPNDKVFTIYK